MNTVRAFLAVAMIAAAPMSASATAAHVPLQPQVVHHVRIVSGGVGEAEQQAMLELARDFDFFTILAGRHHGYLANVDVKVLDATGRTSFETTTLGPMLLAQLRPGHYTIEAHVNGYRTARQDFEVHAHRQTRIQLDLHPVDDAADSH